MPGVLLSLLTSVLPDILKRILPGETVEEQNQRLQIQADLVKEVMADESIQNQVNIEEAKSESLFVSGWRPAVGWICAIGLLLTAFSPILNIIFLKSGLGALPHLDTSELNTILMGMLGLGGMRTFEKINFTKASGFKK